jgi:hypothetical protein|tara:strand:- start:454 stop:627 length:174 start_codon:yes stop_codon:yes gene_type:complete
LGNGEKDVFSIQEKVLDGVFYTYNHPRGRTLEFAHIAQLVEHFLGKEEVTGSNPVMG